MAKKTRMFTKMVKIGRGKMTAKMAVSCKIVQKRSISPQKSPNRPRPTLSPLVLIVVLMSIIVYPNNTKLFF